MGFTLENLWTCSRELPPWNPTVPHQPLFPSALLSEIWQMQRAGGLLALNMPCPCSSMSCTLCSPRNGLGTLQSPQGWGTPGKAPPGLDWLWDHTSVLWKVFPVAPQAISGASLSFLTGFNWCHSCPVCISGFATSCFSRMFEHPQVTTQKLQLETPQPFRELTQRSRSQQRKKQQELLKPT